jgi:hypothetical protein
MDFIDKIMAYEDGSLTDDQELELYSELISTGQAWTLQGSYGRTAKAYMDLGYLNESGDILKRFEDEG